MRLWEKPIQEHFKRLECQTEWVHLGRGTVFILVWKGKEVQVVHVDFRNTIRRASVSEVKEEYLTLIGYLIRQSNWERVFKGRDVLFKWLTLQEPSEDCKRVLASAGVEPLLFPGSEEYSA